MSQPPSQLLYDLRDPNRFIRGDAICAIYALAQDDAGQLIALLPGVMDRKARLRIAEALASTNRPAVVATLLALLADRWMEHERWALAVALASMDDERAERAALVYFQQQLASVDWTTRRDATHQLQNLALPEVELLLRRATADRDAEVRSAAQHGLEARAQGRAPHKWRRGSAAAPKPPARPRRGDDKLLEAYLRELATIPPREEQPASHVRRLELVRALQELGDPRALPTLSALCSRDTIEWDLNGMGVGVSVAELAEEAIEHIEWRMRRQGLGVEHEMVASKTRPPAPFELQPLLGSRTDSADIERAWLSLAGLATIQDHGRYRSYAFPPHGISFIFEEQQLSMVRLYAQQKDGFLAWPYELPHGLAPDHERRVAQRLLREPDLSSSQPGKAGNWDRWLFADHSIYLSYASRQGLIEWLTIEEGQKWCS